MTPANPPTPAASAPAPADPPARLATAPAPANSARDVVLARIRAALGDRSPSAPDVPRDYRLTGDHPAGDPALLDLLKDRLVDYRATVHRTTAADLPSTLSSVWATLLPDGGRVIIPAGLSDSWTPSNAAADVRFVRDDAVFDAAALDGFDAVLTGCAAAAGETGTIALDASPDQGRRAISLVPDRHVCVVRADQVVQSVPELLARLDPRRPLTLISGPSATSDIELQRVEGVHGPRTLVVVLVAD